MPKESSAIFAVVYDNRVAEVKAAMAAMAGVVSDQIVKASMAAEVATQLKQQFVEGTEKHLAESAAS